MNNWKKKGLIAAVIIVLLIPIAGIKFKLAKLNRVETLEPQFVGGLKCLECHENEHKEWERSHHANAMAHVGDSTVLGNFNNAEYTSNGITHKFYKRDGKFYVNTKGVGGKMAEYEISHTFGYTPLQQYLVPFERGKYQCLPIAWNTEKGEWFDMGAMIYEGQDIKPDDWLYWTNQAQNWNGMCSECHSTNLRKNYIAESDSFHTTWSEINVSCESCHGPGSEHVKWADWPELKQQKTENFGLLVKTSGINNEEYVNLCARCHTRRSQLGNFNHKSLDPMDFMVPTLLHDDYFSDGQILDEDYVWGSFTQSKMYHNDIKCNDCHNVHSGERLFDDNRLCYQCHQENYYGSAKHHFHKTVDDRGGDYYIDGRLTGKGEGSLCINCHMPARNYMGIDSRNDHSIRIPRPDLSKKLGTPNACNQCHKDKTSDWAIQYTTKWYGTKYRPHYGVAISKGREGKPQALKELVNLVDDTLNPLIARATALELLANYNDPLAINTIKKALDVPESMLRLSAARNYSSNNAEEYIADLSPLLKDPTKAVRMEAGLKFTYLPKELLPEAYVGNFEKALNEFKDHNNYMADFPGGQGNLGLLYSNQGNYYEAIKHFKRSIEIDNQFYPGYVNLALAYNQTGKNNEAEKIYKHLIKLNPEMPGIHYSLGLLLVELKKYDEAIKYLEIATTIEPENSRINYNLGLLYTQLKNYQQAEKQLQKAVNKENDNFDYQYALASFYINSGQFTKAKKYVNKLLNKYNGNESLVQLSNYLKSLNI
ncbi:MAG: tetratricopeptide repeat protein [Bacteroidota bacterium]